MAKTKKSVNSTKKPAPEAPFPKNQGTKPSATKGGVPPKVKGIK